MHKMRRVFIIRKDLNLSHGKLAAMVGHCCEAYWTNLLKASMEASNPYAIDINFNPNEYVQRIVKINKDIWDQYVNGIFTKTICEAKNMNQLRKVDQYIEEVNSELPIGKKLTQRVDYGWINDKCLTELTPENDDGTTTIGIWFRPLPDDIAHKISKKYKLYGAFDDRR